MVLIDYILYIKSKIQYKTDIFQIFTESLCQYCMAAMFMPETSNFQVSVKGLCCLELFLPSLFEATLLLQGSPKTFYDITNTNVHFIEFASLKNLFWGRLKLPQ